MNTGFLYSQCENVAHSDQNTQAALDIFSEDLDAAIQSAEPEFMAVLHALYLRSVYFNAPLTAGFLVTKGAHRLPPPINMNNYPHLKTMMPVSGSGLSDVCCAILSCHSEAHLSLARLLSVEEIQGRIGQREVIPPSHEGLRNRDAARHTILDIAVMQYVALRRVDVVEQEGIKSHVSRLLSQMQKAGMPAPSAVTIVPNGTSLNAPIQSRALESKIVWLIQQGARGSGAAYFPSAEESIAEPFTDRTGFEVMSLQEFCNEQKSLISANVLSVLQRPQEVMHMPSL
jgi:hypothetical protein